MILSKTSNNNWVPTAGGTGTFIGTLAAFNAIKDTLPVNTVAYITDDGNGDLQPIDAVTDGNMHPVTSNAVYDKLYGNAGTYYAKSINRPAGGWTINSDTGHMVLSSADLTIANVPAGVYLAWIEASGDQNTAVGKHYCYNNSIASASFGFQETGWGGTIWPSCIYKHTGGNVVPSLATDFENFNPSNIRMVLQRLY